VSRGREDRRMSIKLQFVSWNGGRSAEVSGVPCVGRMEKECWRILLVAVAGVAGLIGISGVYPQIIDSEWARGSIIEK
jgi:hypothetical protein